MTANQDSKSTVPKHWRALPPLTPAWSAVKGACDPAVWIAITPMVRQALLDGTAPAAVGEATVRSTVAAARARGNVSAPHVAAKSRLGWNRVAEAAPELQLPRLPATGKETHLPRLPPAWAAVERACDPENWRHITPLVRQAVIAGIAPADVDESTIQAMAAAAGVRGRRSTAPLAMYARLGWGRLRTASPWLNLRPIAKPGREAPRRDQWDALEPGLRDEIAAFIVGLGRQESANVAVRNKLLRALEAAEEQGIEIETIDDLFGRRGVEAILGHERFFGVEGKQHESRSDVLELARTHARSVGDVERYAFLQDLIDDKATLPTTRSPVSPEDLLAVGVLLREGAFERLVDHTAAAVEAFAADPTEDNCGNAQACLVIRVMVALSLFRKAAIRLAFTGPRRSTAFGSRPTLSIPDREGPGIEETLSPVTLGLLDRFFEAHRRAFGAPVSLYGHPDGRAKTAEALSTAIGRNGRAVGLEVSSTILRTYTVARIIAHMRVNGGTVDVERLKDHLDIDQAVNFRSRFGPLLVGDVYEQLSRSALA